MNTKIFIKTLSREEVMRSNKMITNLLSNSVNQFFKEMYGDQFKEFASGYWDLIKGLIQISYCRTLPLNSEKYHPSSK